jgi:cytochrome c-type biogenesis protein CcmH
MTSRILNAILLAMIVVILLAGAASADTPEPGNPTDDDVNSVASQLYCPVCENIPLDVCPTQACAQWRDLIREKLAAGWSDEQIKQYFVDQYGDRVLAEPPRRGLHWIIYVLPPLFFLGGVYLVVRVLRSMRKPVRKTAAGPVVTSASVSNDDPYLIQMEEELRRRQD